jgi:hypothetical protein
MEKIYELLCVNDKRSPFFIEDEDWPNSQPRTNCSCDYCFYGRDQLALIIIDLIETLETCSEAFQLTDMIDKTNTSLKARCSALEAIKRAKELLPKS